MKDYLVMRCHKCCKTFILLKTEYDLRRGYLTCPFYGKHKDIRVHGSYDNLIECMKPGELDLRNIRNE